ncbi:methyl-accepting chemotaxis protein [Solibacillus silvestris]|uniref:methyl-accepting chemotaxis protein n=1 Tax=Solibacillus silvestris TaxID=76853 RepID=UPI003F814B52
MRELKSIRLKLSLSIIGILVVVICTLMYVTYSTTKATIQQQLEESLVIQANSMKDYVDEKMARIMADVETIATRQEIQNLNKPIMENYLNQQIDNIEEYLHFAIVNEKGQADFFNGIMTDVSNIPAVQSALDGNTVISEIFRSDENGEPLMLVVSPIDTKTSGKHALIAVLDGYMMANIASDVKVGETGFALVLTGEGTVLGHRNLEWVKESLNFIEQAEKNGTMIEEANALKSTVLPDDMGIVPYMSSSGGQRYIAFDTLNNGWKVGLVAMEEEFLASLDKTRNLVIIASIITLLIAMILTRWIALSISKPVNEIRKVSEEYAAGDFTTMLSEKYIHRQDEIGQLAKSIQMMASNTRSAMNNVNDGSVKVSNASIEMGDSIEKMENVMNQIIRAINEVSEGSKTQTVMASESAQSMEQMSQGIQNVAESASLIVENVDFIRQKMREGEQAVADSIRQMRSIQSGAERELQIISLLENESKEIGSISKIITDIADQTNLLALNASIEAARAGEAGKGFAVVADEVRKLSEQTANSAAKINGLIATVQVYTKDVLEAAKGSSENVGEGIATIGNVSERFTEIVQAISTITVEMEGLSAAAEQMSANTEQVSAAVEEMASTARNADEQVQTVTLTVQQFGSAVSTISAESESLEQMAEELQKQVDQFKF